MFEDMNYILFPYDFTDKYMTDDVIKAYTDEEGHCYVLHNGKSFTDSSGGMKVLLLDITGD